MFLVLCLSLLDTQEEQDLFSEIYELYDKYLFRIAFAKLNNQQDAEDAVQDSFLALAFHMSKFTEFSSADNPKIKAYLVTILENKIIDRYRWQKRHEAEDLDALQVCGLKDIPCYNSVYNALHELSNRARVVLLLRFDMGFTPKEIAKQMNVSVWTVYKLIEQAKGALRTILEAENEKL